MLAMVQICISRAWIFCTLWADAIVARLSVGGGKTTRSLGSVGMFVVAPGQGVGHEKRIRDHFKCVSLLVNFAIQTALLRTATLDCQAVATIWTEVLLVSGTIGPAAVQLESHVEPQSLLAEDTKANVTLIEQVVADPDVDGISLRGPPAAHQLLPISRSAWNRA